MASGQRMNAPLSEVRAADQESAKYGDDYAEKEKTKPAPAPSWLRQSATRPHESEFARQKPRDREYRRRDFTDRESLQTPHSQRYVGELEVHHQFSLGSAFRFGLGIGIGLILAIPIGVIIALFIVLAFGSALAEMP